MKLSELGEFGLIARFAQTLNQQLPDGAVGIGDDCAVIPLSVDRSLLVTTDLLVEGVHFLLSTTSAYDLGYKSLAVNLSDIAAMGGRPRSAFLSLALPAETEIAWLDDFLRGLRELATKFDVAILGGDTSRSLSGITINITALGEAAPAQIKFRSSACVGDLICVAGVLGESAAGLRLLSAATVTSAQERLLIQRHVHPEPLIREGEFLAALPDIHAMMDVSDGLDSDLRQIMSRSTCGADIDLEKIRFSSDLLACSKRHGWDPLELACKGGEDYALLMTIAPDSFAEIARAFHAKFARELYSIGVMTGHAGELNYELNGKPHVFKLAGFDHFR